MFKNVVRIALNNRSRQTTYLYVSRKGDTYEDSCNRKWF